jgi:hypothetical protein
MRSEKEIDQNSISKNETAPNSCSNTLSTKGYEPKTVENTGIWTNTDPPPRILKTGGRRLGCGLKHREKLLMSVPVGRRANARSI